MPSLFEASFPITAAHAGVDVNDGSALQAWMQAPVTTRQDVLQTLRNCHVAVIRPEVYHRIAEVENIIAKLDDRKLRIQDNMSWLASENRTSQKREAGLIVLLTGFDPKMEPAARHHQINWMLGQPEDVKQFLFQRQYNATEGLALLASSASGAQSPQSSLEAGTSGSPSWPCMEEARVHRSGIMDKQSPASPQFQRKLELPGPLARMSKIANFRGSSKSPKGQPPFSSLHRPKVPEVISYSWDEYCDKFSKADLKVGDYRAAIFCGVPATPPEGPNASGLSAPLKSAPLTGKGKSKS